MSKTKLPPALRETLGYRKSSIDYDYLDKLNPTQLEFLANFTEGYYCGAPHRDKMQLTPKKESYALNNRRNRDALNRPTIEYLDDLNPDETINQEAEPCPVKRREKNSK